MINIYTDGSCISTFGGWAYAIIETDGFIFVDSGNEKATTNNRMELKAVIEVLKFIDTKNEYTIFSDSQLTINCATNKWKRKSNIDLWNEYDVVAKDKNITFEWIKSHN